MKALRYLIAAVAACSFLSLAALAADPTGTWTWTQAGGRDGTPRTITATLSFKDGKLTGTVAGGFGEPAPISEASVTGDAVAFVVRREFNGNAFVSKYTAKLEGDTLRGSIELPAFGGGEPRKIDWVATRAK